MESIAMTPPRRSFSLPATKPATPDSSQIEVLYNLPSARVISFSTGNTTSRPSSSSGSSAKEEVPGTLSWSSRLERTIAMGPLRIYRAPGSVAFLNCSNALQPILPKSQCWEVDGTGKFVLQIRPPQYWRIEVPNMTKMEKMQIEELKEVLAKVLLFEKTPCPFQRDFTVELPEAPQTPVRKRPWKPVKRSKTDMSPIATTLEEEIVVACVPSESVLFSSPEENPVSIRPSASRPQYNHFKSMPNIVEMPIELVSLDHSPILEARQDEAEKSETQPKGYAETETVIEPPPPALPIYPTSEIHSSSNIEQPIEDSEEITSTSPSGIPVIEGPLAPVFLPSNIEDSIFNSYHGLEEEDSFSDATDDTNITPRSILQPAFQSMFVEPEKETRPQALQHCSRSITAPPVLSLITSPPSKQGRMSPLRSAASAGSDSDFSSSVDSFHSVKSWHSPLAPPSPPASSSSSPTSTYPYPHDNIVLPKRSSHSRDTSEFTVTPETPKAWDMSPIPNMDAHLRSLSPPPRTPTLVTDGSEKSDAESFEIVTPPTIRSSIRHRATTSSNSRRRTLSPLPAAVNLFSPPRRRNRRLQTARHLPTAIIQKTCEILLSPPSHLLQLMLNIASKIAAGEWRGVLSGHGESVHWDFEDEYAGEGCFEDDYGISLAKTSSNSKKSDGSGGSWEVD